MACDQVSGSPAPYLDSPVVSCSSSGRSSMNTGASFGASGTYSGHF